LPILRPEWSTFHHTDSKEPPGMRTDHLSPSPLRPHLAAGSGHPTDAPHWEGDAGRTSPRIEISWYGSVPYWSSGYPRSHGKELSWGGVVTAADKPVFQVQTWQAAIIMKGAPLVWNQFLDAHEPPGRQRARETFLQHCVGRGLCGSGDLLLTRPGEALHRDASSPGGKSLHPLGRDET
jgi:hypothetical protein